MDIDNNEHQNFFSKVLQFPHNLSTTKDNNKCKM